METIGLGAGSYPEPPERETKEVELEIFVRYIVSTEVPKEWTLKDLQEDFKDNPREYLIEAEMEDFEIESR